MAVNDTVQLAVNGVCNGQDHVHTLHFRYTDVTPTAPATLINEWQGAPRTAYRAIFRTVDNPVVLLVARHICGAIPLIATVEEAEVAPNIAGSRAGTGEKLPAYLSRVVSVRTALSGRSRRGRFYLGGMDEDEQNNGDLGSVAQGLVQAYIDALMAQFGPSGASGLWRLVVHSPTLAAVPGTQCQDSSTLVTGMIKRVPIGTTKSRKPGSGS